MVKIYFSSIFFLENKDVFVEKYIQVELERRKKIDNLVSPKEKNRSLAAGLLLNYALRQEGMGHAEIEYEERGKPYLANGRMHFNLSHSGDYVVCALSEEKIGIDIQRIEKEKDFLKLAKRFFTEGEADRIANAEEENRRELFTALWCIKESYIKYTGIGLSQGVDHFTINEKEHVILNKQGEKCCNYWIFDKSDYKIAVCTKQEKPEKLQEIELRIS